jgi:hypothetical protein
LDVNFHLFFTEFQEKGTEELDCEEERTQFLQRVLLDYLAVNGQSDQALTYARHFYLAQWYWDADAEKRRPSNGGKLSPSKLLSRKKKTRKKRRGESLCTLWIWKSWMIIMLDQFRCLGWALKQPLHRIHLPVYYAFPSIPFHRYSCTSYEVHYLA